MIHVRFRVLQTLALGLALCELRGTLGAEPAQPVPVDPSAAEAERLLFLIEYIGSDYAGAVRDGAIADPFEYAEMQAFGRAILEGGGVLGSHGASPESLAFVRNLEIAIRRLRPVPEVRDLVSRLTARLLDELDVVSLPTVPPDLARGARLYEEGCLPCHGATGGGDGRAAPFMTPPPNSFRGAEMDLVSPHQVFSAVAHGVEGTAMPSYGWALDRRQMWDVSFFVKTLRESPDPRSDDPGLGLTVHDLSRSSNEELLKRVRRQKPAAQARDVDYYRRHVPTVLASGAGTADQAAVAPGPGEAGDLDTALQLQWAFTHVAERVFPSVVGVSGFARDTSPSTPPSPTEKAGAWAAGGEERLYPGFHLLRSGSGFAVGDEGYILTCSDALLGPAGEVAAFVDLELHSGEHAVGRVVGIEPTIHLGVIQREVFTTGPPPQLPPATIGDSDRMRVGQWTIALGDPRGPGTAFAVGLLSSQPERQCYQDQLSATLLQSSVATHPEACGGPLVNIHGEVVGLNLPVTSVVGAGTSALPIQLALGIADALKIKESRISPWLGISVLEIAAARRALAGPVDPNTLSRTGVYIDNVWVESPASRAGMRIGDCLEAIDGQRLFSVADFQKWMYLSGVGREVTLEIFRAGETLSMRATIEARPKDAVPR